MSRTLNHSPAEIIQYYLDDQSLGSLPSSDGLWPVFATSMPDTPDNAICVYDTEGKGEGREHISGATHFQHGIQVRVRSSSHKVGYQKAGDIILAFDALHRAEVPLGSDTYMIHAVNMTSPILPLGLDEAPASRRRSFVINALVIVTPRAGTG